MNNKLLIIFENIKISESNLKFLNVEHDLILFDDKSNEFDQRNWNFYPKKSIVRYGGEIAAPKFLFSLRDSILSSVLYYEEISLVLYGGGSTWMMPQYYIFKKLLKGQNSKIYFYLSPHGDGNKNLLEVLGDPDFDGVAHNFEEDNSFGFKLFYEI